MAPQGAQKTQYCGSKRESKVHRSPDAHQFRHSNYENIRLKELEVLLVKISVWTACFVDRDVGFALNYTNSWLAGERDRPNKTSDNMDWDGIGTQLRPWQIP